MRPILVILGILIFLAGAVFSLQGAGVLPGSFMTGSPTWLVIGIVLVAVGVVFAFFGVRGGRTKIAEAPRQPPT